MRIVFNTLEGSYALCLLANLVQLAHFEREASLPGLSFPTFTVILTYIFATLFYVTYYKIQGGVNWFIGKLPKLRSKQTIKSHPLASGIGMVCSTNGSGCKFRNATRETTVTFIVERSNDRYIVGAIFGGFS